MAKIHSTAIVENSVKLDETTEVGAYCILKGNVTIGQNTVLHSHISIEGNTKIGENCEIFPFASIGSKPQDYKFKNEITYTEIGNNNIIREHVTINAGTAHGTGITKIGNHNMLMINSHIGHDTSVGNYCTIANNVPLGGHVILEDFVIVGGNSAVHQFIKIGSYSMVGGMIGVKENIIPYSLVTPCNNSIYGGIRGVNIVGLKRKNFSKEAIQTIHNAFEILSDKTKSIEEKIGIILQHPNEYTQNIIDFIKSSQQMEHSKGLAPFIVE